MLTLERLRIEQDAFTMSADLAVAAGQKVAIIGPSGAGKSTLLAAIAGFVAPAAGRILWQGQDLGPLDPGARPMSIIFQDNNLFPHLSAADNVALGLSPALRLSPDDRRQVAAALARVGLEGFENRRPGALSGGQQSRVALARALLRHRPLMLLDEPFAALGPAQRAEMMGLVNDLAAAERSTVLMVTHDPDDALRLGGQTIVVAEGTAHAPRDTAALLADPPPALHAYLG